ncbi:hypothetical protein AB3N59_11615 [Leptospira sp. WS92.C1]
MKIQHFGTIFLFFNVAVQAIETRSNLSKDLFSGDTLVFGGISLSLLFLFGLVLKESVQKSRNVSEKKKDVLSELTKPISAASESVSVFEDVVSRNPIGKESFRNQAVSVKSSQVNHIWKREVPIHPELVLAHQTFLEQLSSKVSFAELCFLSGDISLLLASRNGKLFHLPESPEEQSISDKSLKDVQSGRICFTEEFVYIPLATGIQPFGYLKIAASDWKQLTPREFHSWKEEYEERVSIQFESSDPETGFGNLHAFELDKIRVHENILIFASLTTLSSMPYVLKWVSLWTSKILRKQIRFYRIRQDRVAFFLSPEEWETFSKNLKELVESLQKESHPVDLNLGVSILEENRESWVLNARKALGQSMEQGPNRYICL